MNNRGFRNKHSTDIALLELIEKINDGFEKSKFTVGTYIDLKKASDTIYHSILLEKLQCYGIRGLSLNWINSYLSNRTQFTNYGSVRPEIKGIKCGVPQGSILGPTLFILFINDIRNFLMCYNLYYSLMIQTFLY